MVCVARPQRESERERVRGGNESSPFSVARFHITMKPSDVAARAGLNKLLKIMIPENQNRDWNLIGPNDFF